MDVRDANLAEQHENSDNHNEIFKISSKRVIIFALC